MQQKIYVKMYTLRCRVAALTWTQLLRKLEWKVLCSIRWHKLGFTRSAEPYKRLRSLISMPYISNGIGNSPHYVFGLASRWYETQECDRVAKELTSIGMKLIRRNLMELAVYILVIRLEHVDSLQRSRIKVPFIN